MKLVILDRDGVINHDSAEFIKNPDEWVPIPGSLEAIARLNQAGYHVVLATNQSGVGRGLLEFKADPTAPSHDPQFRPDRPVILYCASGGRASLAGKTLKDMGYADVRNLGGFAGWKAAGGEVE